IVYDSSKAIITGAKVTATNKARGVERATISNSTGEYIFSAMQPGEYEIKISVSGFKTQIIPITLQVGETLTADVNMEVGQANETVVITGESAVINTSDHKIDGVVSRQQVENLPLNGRNFLQLAMLEPGVTVEATDAPGTSPNNFFRVSIAGAGQALTRISVDGATINDRVTGGTAQNFSQETVQEFQISSFNFDLSTSVTGVGSINVISRTGTNDFHGSGFMYFRDHNMAAYPSLRRSPRRFTDPGLDDPFFARRQYGGSIGGPIKKDKLFFFYNIERNNQAGVTEVTNEHPIFSLFDGTYSNPLKFLQNNIRFDYKVNDNHNAFFRFSTDNNKNFAGANGIFLPSNWVDTKNVSTQGLLGVTSVFTPKVVNDFRYSYGFYSGRLNIPFESCTDPIACIGLGQMQVRTTLSDFIIGNNLNTPQNRVLRTYQLTDTVSWQKSSHRLRFGGEWEHFNGIGHWAFLEPGLAVVWDPLHLLAFQAHPQLGPAARAIYASLPDSLKLNATGTGPLVPGRFPTFNEIMQLPLFQFLEGIGDPGQPQQFRVEDARRNDRFRLFIVDQWRVREGFTLNLGLSWSMETNVLNHDLDRPAILSSLVGGDLSAPKRDKNNFGPSIGFAWDVNNNGKMVIRGGGGIYHDSNLFWTRLNERAYVGPSGNGRYILPESFFASLRPDLNNTRRFPTNYRGTNLLADLATFQALSLGFLGNGQDLSVRGVERLKTIGEAGFGAIFDPNTVTPYSMNVSAGIQRELMQNLAISADFVMRRSVKFGGQHALFFVDRNRFNGVAGPVIPRCQGAQLLDPKAICSTGAIAVAHSGGMFRYTGLHVKMDKRFSNRYLFVASYALSKYSGFNGVINYDNLYEADGYQGADRTHKFTFSGFMDLPTYGGDNRFLRGMFNSWSVGLISQFNSKPALTTTVGVDHDGDGIGTFILPGATFRSFGRNVDKKQLQELVAQYNANFAGKPAPRGNPFPTINLPAGFDHGDYFISQDIRLTRNIKFSENVTLQLIGEAFNLFNISNLAGYQGGLNSGCEEFPQGCYGIPQDRAGGVFGTGGPRAFQIAARLSF
ncbi:MAG: TonB-dependent receptor, partial [Acidobacteria bacterium]|nr:TonB-dependent receptor [Acidobacteriota bacterium]